MGDELNAALAAEEAAIYAYGLLGVRLSGDRKRDEARAAEAVHRDRRDVLVSRLAQLKASPAPAPAGYRLPFAVTGDAGAVKLAAQVEDGVAAAWRAVLPAAAEGDRATALAAMVDSAVRATRWRKLGRINPLTIPFPGRPGAG